MYAKIIIYFLLIGIPGVLTVCNPRSTVEPATPLSLPTTISDAAAVTATAASTSTALAGFDCQSVREIPLKECQALVALFESTNGENWKDNSGWLRTTTPCSWYGVTCSAENVESIDLSYNQLSGTIPAQLGKLEKLYRLDLSYNELSGSLPDELASQGLVERRLWGNRLDGTIFAVSGPLNRVEYGGIRFSYPSDLAESVWPEIIPAVPPTLDRPWWEVDPEHFSFTFASLSGPDAIYRIWGPWRMQLPPQILIYPIAGVETNEDTRREVEALRALLEKKPKRPVNEIAFLPRMNISQLIRAQVHYLDFQNGRGVRFITHFTPENPITNQGLFYTFQGLTDDGTNYISTTFPISTAVLPDDMPIGSEAFSEFEKKVKNYEDWVNYLNETAEMLDRLPSHQFEPDLALLDQIIQSLEVKQRK